MPAALLPALADAALKATAVLACAAMLARLRRRAPAAERHLIWAFTLTGLLALPVLSWTLPGWQLPLPLPAAGPGAAPADDGELVAVVAARRAAPDPGPALPPAPPSRQPLLLASRAATPVAVLPVADPPAPPAARPAAGADPAGAWDWVAGLWLGGLVVAVAWLLAGHVSLGRLRRRCLPLDEGPLAERLRELAAGLGIRRRVRLLLSRRRVPMTWGLFRPVVLLPRAAQFWPAPKLDMVLLHELGHVSRRDCLTQLLAHLARGLYWFHPLAWLAAARLRDEQEQACDDVVLRGGAPAPDYAEHLVAVTAGLPAGLFASAVALGMARAGRRLHDRVVRLLDADRSRAPLRPGRMLLVAAAVLGLLLAAATAAPPAAAGPEAGQPGPAKRPAAGKPDGLARRLAEVGQKLRESYVKPLDEKTLTDAAIKGFLEGLNDPHTNYLSLDDLRALEGQVGQKVTGIGVQLQMTAAGPTVRTPLDGSPALKAGLRPGDTIEAIDGKPTRGLGMQDVIKRILGPAGTVVKLKVVRADGVARDVAVTRGQIRVPSVTGFRRAGGGGWVYLLDPRHKVGYLQISHFGADTAREVREALGGLQKEGLKGLILDLRFCPGGLLNQAVDVCKFFLAKGTIVTTKGAGGKAHVFRADGKALTDVPLLVLINGQTASSGEIVAGALRDNGRAVLLGSRTYGKGSVQAIIKLSGGGALRVTTAYHYLPSGRNIQKRPGATRWGVDPDPGYELPLGERKTEAVQEGMRRRFVLVLKKEGGPGPAAGVTPQALATRYADPQLAAALRTMVARLTGGEFVPVGRAESAEDRARRLAELRRQRESLLRDLGRLDREIGDLQGPRKK
jgi:carboxyl-terminal processing protease